MMEISCMMLCMTSSSLMSRASKQPSKKLDVKQSLLRQSHVMVIARFIMKKNPRNRYGGVG